MKNVLKRGVQCYSFCEQVMLIAVYVESVEKV